MASKTKLEIGAAWRKGKIVVNIHDIKDGRVYYGKYDDDAHDAPEHCIGLFRVPIADFRAALRSEIKRGAVAVNTLFDDLK
jgi:hypothetical protein